MSDEPPLEDPEPPRPRWDDEYLEAVADRLMYHYDLERDRDVDGTLYDLYGIVQVESRTHVLHPMLDYGNHYSYEHLFARRRRSIGVADLETQIGKGHDLANRWIAPDSEHHSTDFTFVSIVPEIPDAVAEFVTGHKDRNLMKFGYHGHYEINLVVVAPEREDVAASPEADVYRAFRTWKDVENVPTPGLIGRILRTIRD